MVFKHGGCWTRVVQALAFDACGNSTLQLKGVVGLRSIHQAAALQRFYESSPKGEYRDWKKTEEEFAKIQRDKWWGFKDGFKDLRDEIKKMVGGNEGQGCGRTLSIHSWGQGPSVDLQ